MLNVVMLTQSAKAVQKKGSSIRSHMVSKDQIRKCLLLRERDQFWPGTRLGQK